MRFIKIFDFKNNFRAVFSKDNKQMELIFNSNINVEKWKQSPMDAGFKCNYSDTNFYTLDSDSDTLSVSNLSIANGITSGQTNGQKPPIYPRKSTDSMSKDSTLPKHLRPQIEVVMKLVDSYINILKKTFK